MRTIPEYIPRTEAEKAQVRAILGENSPAVRSFDALDSMLDLIVSILDTIDQ